MEQSSASAVASVYYYSTFSTMHAFLFLSLELLGTGMMIVSHVQLHSSPNSDHNIITT
jgi:hypothetical protein